MYINFSLSQAQKNISLSVKFAIESFVELNDRLTKHSFFSARYDEGRSWWPITKSKRHEQGEGGEDDQIKVLILDLEGYSLQTSGKGEGDQTLNTLQMEALLTELRPLRNLTLLAIDLTFSVI